MVSVCSVVVLGISFLVVQCHQKIGSSVAVRILVGQGSTSQKPLPLEQLLLSASLCVGNLVLPLQALVNSVAQDSLLNEELAEQAGCSLEPLLFPFTTTVLDGGIIARVTHRTDPVPINSNKFQ